MGKKILAILLSAIMCLSVTSAGFAADTEDTDAVSAETEQSSVRVAGTDVISGECGDNLTWTLSEDGTLRIDGTGEMSDWEDYPDVPWCDYCESIKKTVIADGVETIGRYAFFECTNMTEVVFGNSLKYIDTGAFHGCTSLSALEFPDSLIGIGQYAFYQCENLVSVSLPDQLIFLDTGVFSYCEKLTDIEIPGTVIYLGDETWARETLWCCESISGYTNSAAYWYAQKYKITFNSLGMLAEGDEGYVGGAMTATGEKGDFVYWILYEDGQVFFCGIGEMDDTNVGNGLSAELLLSYRIDVKNVVFTNGITSIGSYTLSDGTASGNKDKKFENLETVKIADSITKIGNYAFYGCPVLQSIELGAGVSSLGNCVFSYDYSLSEIIVDEDNESFVAVDNVLFSKDMSTLYRYPHNSDTSYTIPDGTQTLALDAFGDCDVLESIIIPVSVTVIENYAFDGCTALNDVYYAGSESEWDEITIGGSNTCLTEATIHYAKADAADDSETGDTDDSGSGDTGGNESVNTGDSESENTDDTEDSTSSADTFLVRRGNWFYVSYTLKGGDADMSFTYGKDTDEVLIGDWDGDGIDTICVRRGNRFYFSNTLGGQADFYIDFGRTSDEVVVGDWDGDGYDTICVRRGNHYYINNTLESGNAAVDFTFGRVDDEVLAGDWDGDGYDTLCIRRGNIYYINNTLEGGNAVIDFTFGRTSDSVLSGDWDGDGYDTLCIRRGNHYYINNTLEGGNAAIDFTFGRDGDEVYAGTWR